MIVPIVACVIGILLIIAGVYYLAKEKADSESRRIYAITLLVGVVITAVALIKLFVLG